MRLFLKYYARAVAVVGSAILLLTLLHGEAWVTRTWSIALLFAATAALRRFQIPVTKYSALNLLGLVAVGGSIISGAPATALALYGGVFLADWLLMGKPAEVGRMVQIAPHASNLISLRLNNHTAAHAAVGAG